MRHDVGGAGMEVVRVDPDQPTSGSLPALAFAATSCDAIIAADVGRADLPSAASTGMPWVTWVTTPRVPPHHPAGANDALLLADEAWKPKTLEAGWPVDRIRLTSWPALHDAALCAPAPTAGGDLAIVADTFPLDPPERLREFSSHLLLWDRLRADLSADPFRLGDDPEQFLGRAMEKFGVAAEGFDRRLFIDRLLVPAYQQGLARILLREKLPLRLHGAGWDRIDTFREHAAGPVTSFRRLKRIARTAAAFVHVWPGGYAHPIDALGRPVVRRRDPRGASFVSDAMRALAGRQTVLASTLPPLTLDLVASLLTGRV
jgi:hypothetical protein